MKPLFYEVQAGKAAYTRTLICKETGVTVTILIPIEVAEKEELINRVSQAIATVDCLTIKTEEGSKGK